MDSFQDSRLLAGLLHGIEDLAKRPADALLPYEDQIAALSTQLQRLEANVNAHARRASLPLLEPFVSPLDRYHFTDSLEPDFGACPELNPGSISNSSSVSMSSGNDTNPTTTISHLVSSAFVHFRSASPRLRKLQSIPFDRWFAQDERLVHLRPIFNMQKNRMSRASDPKERLLLINSCMSLADEFRDFEVERGWSAKQDILTDCIIHNQPLAVQKIGKHSQEFVHSLKLSNRMDVSDLDDRRLDAGLRLGTKLNVVRQVGKACGYGSVLALLMAFELSKLSRLPYHALKYLRSVCCFSNTESIEEVTKEFDEWWESCCLAYRKKFGSARVDYDDNTTMQSIAMQLADDIGPCWSEELSSPSISNLSEPSTAFSHIDAHDMGFDCDSFGLIPCPDDRHLGYRAASQAAKAVGLSYGLEVAL